MGYRRDLVGEVQQLTERNVALSQENERLQRLQLNGPAAAIATTIEDEVNKWVDGGYLVDPTSGIPTSSFDTVYGIAIRQAITNHAGEAFKSAEPEKQIGLLKEILTPTQFLTVAMEGLRAAVITRPQLLGELLPPEELKDFAFTLAKSEDDGKIILDVLKPKPKGDDYEDIDLQLETEGRFSTDNLKPDMKTSFIIADSNNNHVVSVSGTTVGSAHGSWLLVERVERHRDNSPMKVGIVQGHKIRLGSIDEDENYVQELNPIDEWQLAVFFEDGMCQPLNSYARLATFSINGRHLRLRQY